jgi:hypothetical protein
MWEPKKEGWTETGTRKKRTSKIKRKTKIKGGGQGPKTWPGIKED